MKNNKAIMLLGATLAMPAHAGMSFGAPIESAIQIVIL